MEFKDLFLTEILYIVVYNSMNFSKEFYVFVYKIY